MVNLLICESSYGYGGSGAYLYSFLQYLDKNKFNPIVSYNEKGDGPFIDKIKNMGIELYFLSENKRRHSVKTINNILISYLIKIIDLFLENIFPIMNLILLIRKKKIDLILLNQDVVFHVPAIFVAALLNIPCVVRKGGLGIHPTSKLKWKILSRVPDYYIASSHAENNFHIISGFPYKKMVVIFEGVNTNEFYPKPKTKRVHDEFGISYDTLLVCLISRFDDGKGHEDVISAAPAILKEYSKAAFLIIGDGKESIKNSLIKQVKLLGLQDKIIFTGWRTDTTEILNEIDIFVHCPNLWLEGMGIATLEALASGKPVVITDNWGLSDTTRNNYNGFVVPIGDRHMIAIKILELLKDDSLRAQMGANSRTRALELFAIDKNIKAIEDIMIQTLSSAKRL
jgi:glycosyltransferase involved in cell wall biosynthesis